MATAAATESQANLVRFPVATHSSPTHAHATIRRAIDGTRLTRIMPILAPCQRSDAVNGSVDIRNYRPWSRRIQREARKPPKSKNPTSAHHRSMLKIILMLIWLASNLILSKLLASHHVPPN